MSKKKSLMRHRAPSSNPVRKKIHRRCRPVGWLSPQKSGRPKLGLCQCQANVPMYECLQASSLKVLMSMMPVSPTNACSKLRIPAPQCLQTRNASLLNACKLLARRTLAACRHVRHPLGERRPGAPTESWSLRHSLGLIHQNCPTDSIFSQSCSPSPLSQPHTNATASTQRRSISYRP